jgi:myo-inositol 2-dehydrogenase/D-chiro-inositol 1-dehydrogenase
MVEKVNYGIIGCGMMAGEHIRNIALLDTASVTVVYDPVDDLAHKAADLAGGARVATSLDDLLAEQHLDALVIVSPNHIHLEQLEHIIATRPLPILVEKPLYTDPDHAARVAALAKAADVPIWVAMEYRYMPPIAKLIAEADEVTGGVKMLTIREHRFPFLPKVGDWNRFNANTGGTLVEKCCHFFDLMRLVLKAEPVQVMASAGQVVNHLDERYGGQTPDIWDCGYVIVDFDNGARAMLELSMFAEGSRYQEEVSAVGPKAKIEAQVPGPGRFWPDHLGPAPTPLVTLSPRDPQGPITLEVPVDPELLDAGDHNGSTFYQHQRFLNVVRGTGSVEVTLSDGAKAVAMGMAAQKSAREGCVVKL